MRIFLILIFGVLLFFNNLSSQSSDSLKQLLLTEPNDSLILLIAVTERTPDSVLLYGYRAVNEVDTLAHPELFADALKAMSTAYYKQSKQDTAIIFAHRAVQLYQQQGKLKKAGLLLSNIGIFNKNLGNYDEAITAFRASVLNLNIVGDSLGARSTYNGYGAVYERKSQLDSALFYYQKSLYLYEKGNIKKGRSHTINNIGNIYFYQKDYDNALLYRKKALDLAIETKDTNSILSSLNNIGGTHIKAERWEEALTTMKEAEILNFNENIKSNCFRDIHLGVIYSHFEEYEKAIHYLVKAEKAIVEIKHPILLYEVYTNLGNTYKKQENYPAALNAYKKAEEYATDQPDLIIKSDLFSQFSELYYDIGDIEKAYKYLQKGYILKDTILTEENLRVVKELAAKYQTKLYQDSITIVNTKAELVEAESNRQKNWKYFFFSIALLISLIAWLFKDRLDKANARKKRIEEENELFISQNQKIKAELQETTEFLTSRAFLDKQPIIISEQRLFLGDIVYLKSNREVVNIHTRNGMIRFYGSLKNILERLSEKSYHFVQVHRSHIVNLSHIKEIQGTKIFLDNGESIPIGYSYDKKVFRPAYQAYLEKNRIERL